MEELPSTNPSRSWKYTCKPKLVHITTEHHSSRKVARNMLRILTLAQDKPKSLNEFKNLLYDTVPTAHVVHWNIQTQKTAEGSVNNGLGRQPEFLEASAGWYYTGPPKHVPLRFLFSQGGEGQLQLLQVASSSILVLFSRDTTWSWEGLGLLSIMIHICFVFKLLKG